MPSRMLTQQIIYLINDGSNIRVFAGAKPPRVIVTLYDEWQDSLGYTCYCGDDNRTLNKKKQNEANCINCGFVEHRFKREVRITGGKESYDGSFCLSGFRRQIGVDPVPGVIYTFKLDSTKGTQPTYKGNIKLLKLKEATW